MSDTIASFSDLNLPEPIIKVISELGYETPSPIQSKCIPLIQKGVDVIGQAQTGTGKTAAFAMPILSNIELAITRPQALVLTPTRELAVQVAEAFQVYARHLRGFHVLPVYGGQAYGLQLKQLKRGAHVVVGTPGRILDHLRRGTLDLSQLKTLVLDEADEMLRMGFIDDVEEIMAETPSERQTALFSATMPKPIQRIAKRYMRDPQEVKIVTKTATVENIKQSYRQVNEREKLEVLARLLETEAYDGVIIFVRTKTATVELAEKLEARGHSSSPLNGDMNQQLRERTVSRLKSGALDILVATDVAARGLDVKRISLVVNYDIPYDTEAYVHRIGRTGRAGREGRAILFITPRERRLLKAIERTTRQTIEQMELPTREQVTAKRVEAFRDKLSAVLEKVPMPFFRQLNEQLEDELNLDSEELAAALLYLAQKDKPLQLSKESEKRGKQEGYAKDKGGRDKGFKDKGFKDKDKGFKEKGAKGKSRREPSVPMELYRIEVGEDDGVQVKNIVGAIANEGDIESRYIGDVSIYDDHATVELPEGMPGELLDHLKRTYICQKPMRMSRAGLAEGNRSEEAKPHSKGKKPKQKLKLKPRDKK